MTITSFIFFIIALAFLFDFINGFHDAANSIATMVATKILSPRTAVLWAAFFNFIAFLFFHLHVANTVGTGLIAPQVVEPYLIFSSLIAAILWNLITWYFGLPSSSSHALIGGLVGAALAKAGVTALNLANLTKILLSIAISPLLSLFLALLLMFVAQKSTHSLQNVNRWFARIQFISAALLSLGHGGNDAQKTMGIIAVLLFSTGILGQHFYVPWWVIISCNFVMALGTFAGGWRIVKTLGSKITHLTYMSGSCAETAAAATLFFATNVGIPVSTTHTITGAIAGVGIYNGPFAIQWRTLHKILWAWLLTIPATALLSSLITWGIATKLIFFIK